MASIHGMQLIHCAEDKKGIRHLSCKGLHQRGPISHITMNAAVHLDMAFSGYETCLQ